MLPTRIRDKTMKNKGFKKTICIMFAIVLTLVLNGCSKKPITIDTWKGWILSRAKVEGYKPMDLAFQFVDERIEAAKFIDYHEKFEEWWFENGNVPKSYEDGWVSYDEKIFEMENEREDFNTYYYPILAKLTLINALCSNDESQDADDIADALAMLYLGLMGDEAIMLAFLEYAEESMDLHNLQNLSRADLKKSMDEVINEDGFSLYKTMLKTDDKNDEMWWGADNVSRLALEFKDEFFANVMAILGDFSGLEQIIENAVSVYNCEYNSGMSSDKADVYDVIYSVKDKMYVKCSILESNGIGEIKINGKSTHLLSL